MVQILSLCLRANLISCGSRAMVPSSFMISQSTPMGRQPASVTRSTTASVWPERWSTPPGLARSGKHVAGLDEIVRQRGGVGHDLDGAGAVGGADAGGDAVGGVHADLEIRAKAFAVFDDHLLDAELLEAFRGGGHADQAAAEPGHEIDGLRRGPFAGHDQIALVLAVRIVHHDDHAALAEVGHDGFDGVEPFLHNKSAYHLRGKFQQQNPWSEFKLQLAS